MNNRFKNKLKILLLFLLATIILGIVSSSSVSAKSEKDITTIWAQKAFHRSCIRKSPVAQQEKGIVGDSVFPGQVAYIPSYGFGGAGAYDNGKDGKVYCSTILKNVTIPKYGKNKYSNNWEDGKKAEATMIELLSYTKTETEDGSTINLYGRTTFSGTETRVGKTTNIPKSKPRDSGDVIFAQLKYDANKKKWSYNQKEVPDFHGIPAGSVYAVEITGNSGNQTLEFRLQETSEFTKNKTGYSFSVKGNEKNKRVKVDLTNDIEETSKNISDAFKNIVWNFNYSYTPTSSPGDSFGAIGNLFNQQKKYEGTFRFSANPTSQTSGGFYTADGDMKGKYDSDLSLNNEDLYVVYAYYVKAYVEEIGGEIICDTNDFNNRTKVKLKSGSGVKDCAVNFAGSEPKDKQVSGYNKGTPKFVTMQDVINALNGMSKDTIKKINDNQEISPTENQNSTFDNPDAAPQEPEKSCTSEAGPLGYLFCPLAQALANAVDGLYDKLEEKMQLEPELFSEKNASGQDSGILKGWRQFLDIANGAFIIILLIVIFSQLTGVGLDNYGIKKVLPRLIVGLILVQASFILSQLAIDLSNIIGSSVSDFFKTIAKGVTAEATSSQLTFTALFTSLIGIAAGASVVVAGVLTIAGGIGAGVGVITFLVPLLFSALSALVSVLLFFVMLGLRQILAIACVVLAPIAFLCNILPNTQKVFKTWTSTLKAVLVFYPICGLLYGIGILTKALLISQGKEVDFYMALVGCLAPFIPFFLAPSLLRKSISAIGELGAKLQGMGRSMRGGLGKASERYKKGDAYLDAQRRSANQLSKWKLEGITGKGGLDKKIADLQGKDDLSRREQRKLDVYRTKSSRASATMKKFAEDEAKATTMSDPTSRANVLSQIADTAESDLADANLEAMKRNGIVLESKDPLTGETIKETREFGVDNLAARLEQLQEKGIDENYKYTDAEKREMYALAKGLAVEPGGTTKLAGIIRGREKTGKDAISGVGIYKTTGRNNNNFMHEMARIATQDSTINNQLHGADKRAKVYLDDFKIGGRYYQQNPANFKQYEDALNETVDIKDETTGKVIQVSRIEQEADRRAPGVEHRIVQKGEAFDEGIYGLSEESVQDVFDKSDLSKAIADAGISEQNRFRYMAEHEHGITGPSTKDVNVVSGPTP